MKSNLYHHVIVYKHAAVNKTLHMPAEECTRWDEKVTIYLFGLSFVICSNDDMS